MSKEWHHPTKRFGPHYPMLKKGKQAQNSGKRADSADECQII
ncbi:hypothetical protein [Pseudomonas sp. gcc21]|nr:hypothetical protein [Pseudomonas sp. gcc21]